jgi:hypothetical protein
VPAPMVHTTDEIKNPKRGNVKLNLDDPTTRLTLRIAADALRPSNAPLDRILGALSELASLSPSPEPLGSAFLRRSGLHVAWVNATDDAGDVLLAARPDECEAIADAGLALLGVARSVRVARPTGAGTGAVLRAWAKVQGLLLLASAGLELSLSDHVELDDGSWASLLVRQPGPHALILGAGVDPDHVGHDQTRALVEELDKLLDLARGAGVAATYELYHAAVIDARQADMTPSRFLLDEIGEPAAWVLAVADRCGDDVVREALALDEGVLPRLRAAQARNEVLRMRVAQLRNELDES